MLGHSTLPLAMLPSPQYHWRGGTTIVVAAPAVPGVGVAASTSGGSARAQSPMRQHQRTPHCGCGPYQHGHRYAGERMADCPAAALAAAVCRALTLLVRPTCLAREASGQILRVQKSLSI
ncbi:MAG: hypothetical protein LLG44_10575 [Chloroflexi bacterium]|nr:hypothetical protein [Chloroflexota bacterium]